MAGGPADRALLPRLLPGVQTVEYLRAFLFGRLGWNRLGGNLIISGAFGLFRRDYLLAIRGYLTGNVTGDMDLVVRLQRYLREHRLPDTMPFVPDRWRGPRCPPRAPCSGASASGGTAGSSPPCGRTAT